MLFIDDVFYDCASIEARVDDLSEALGLQSADPRRYAVCFAQTLDWFCLFLAIREAGASVLPIHPGTPLPAARRLAENAGCGLLFHNSLVAEALLNARPSAPGGELLQMSSGTTGAPKCIARRWEEIETEIESYVAHFREPEAMTPVIACPITHSYGLICGLLVGLKRGKAPVVLNTANPKYVLRRLREIENPLLYSSPAMLHTLACLVPSGEKIHALMTSGTLLPEAWFTRIRGATQYMFQQYGCSEAGCIAINPDVLAAGDIGVPLPHHRVRAGEDAAHPAEIIVEGANSPVHTRDLGYFRPDGSLVFVSRMDDMINVSGLNVYPRDVEDVVMVLPGVSDAVAFRVADAFAGERVALVFSASRTVLVDTVREWCRGNLAPHQMPAVIQCIAEVPRQANGKISRREIAAAYEAGTLERRVVEVAS